MRVRVLPYAMSNLFPPTLMAMSLSGLLSTSFQFLRRHSQPIVIGAVVFSLIAAVAQLFLPYTVMTPGNAPVYSDEAVTQQTIFFLILLVIAMVSTTYYYVIAIKKEKNVNKALMHALEVVIPLIGVNIWSFVRSYVWIPVLTLILGFSLLYTDMSVGTLVIVASMVAMLVLSLVYYPRFILAPVIYIQERKDIADSVTASYKRTKGHWGKVIGNVIISGIIACIIAFVIGVVAGMFTLANLTFVANFVSQLGRQFAVAFQATFIVALANSMMGSKSHK